MTVGLSLVVVLAVIVGLLIRNKSLKAGPAVVTALFGFYLHATSLTTGAGQSVQTLLSAISGLHP